MSIRINSTGGRLAIALLALLPVFSSTAENARVTQTKSRLKQLDNQINKLKQTLATAHDKRGTLTRELEGTEKQIGENVRHLRSIQNNMASKQQRIHALQTHVNELNKQLATQQQLLAQHVRTRYKMGEYQPLKWLLNQDDPYTVSRLLTFYQYLVHSRQAMIDEIASTKKNLTINQDNLKTELAEQESLQHKLHAHQQQLEQNKRYHTEVIRTINQDIQSKQHTLTEYQRNKDNLSRLLKTLATESIARPKQPFTVMRHKLPRPVQVARNAVQRLNQGVTFFAGEGTPVHAVYPGKIVFSDWLNGYGLLMIIDHGQGFMTLYAHNQSLFKHKGTYVMQGETIAAVGHSGGLKQNGLYFEVRQRGKAVPPLDWLS
ncbi:peptidase M24 [Legionella taurinensis]|uniref:Peptidase M24 n=1 Tax=Legionella taurinensis TaxID=70611 RepID=A0AB38N3S2_9GAMM|nr:peptidoglycan DD-metalloendopeptidase family protein [Legionella taurinensis]MDX1837713.1 peptidoglycan DD-metalloendopeptidase family protein [Legionella taurinensis]PUT39995.1 peptidase M24 [Legionella taurinensis]PUT43761.1 peptidase M24 [Legionella taurinensis]PUT46106.1 peptidase M24 [Legionella taurinensis]PUT47916.1 peptidase M24 [Legionella taurinensis]